MSDTLIGQICSFLQNVVQAMGLSLSSASRDSGRHQNQPRWRGRRSSVRRGGEGVQALQHLVASVFRRQLGDDNRIVVDCNGFRRDKDAELSRWHSSWPKRPATWPAAGNGSSQSVRAPHRAHGDRRTLLRHVRSIGDAFMKTVIISGRR